MNTTTTTGPQPRHSRSNRSARRLADAIGTVGLVGTILLSSCGSDTAADPAPTSAVTAASSHGSVDSSTGSSVGASATAPPTSDAVAAPAAAPAIATQTTLAGPVAVVPVAPAMSTTGDAARFAVVSALLSAALAGGVTLDAVCVTNVVAMLSPADLDALNVALQSNTGVEPVLSDDGVALENELDSCLLVDNTIVISGAAPDVEDICASVDRATITPLNGSLDSGTNVRVVGPYGPANACEFAGNAGTRVTVTLTRQADLNAWEDEIVDGDGIADGTLTRGIGTLAAVGRGFAAAVVFAEDLIEVSVFPTADVTDAALLQALSAVVDTYAF